MPKRPSKEPPRDPAMEEALRRIKEARELGLTALDLSYLELSTLPEAVQSLKRLKKLFIHGNPGLIVFPRLGPSSGCYFAALD
jgi:hypothetical protein